MLLITHNCLGSLRYTVALQELAFAAQTNQHQARQAFLVCTTQRLKAFFSGAFVYDRTVC
jgi:hypothetical protein